MGPLESAFGRLLDVNDRACGTPQFVLIDGRKVRAIIEAISTDEVVMLGGIAESGGFRCQVPTNVMAALPGRGDAIEARDKQLDVLSARDVNGIVYELVAGDIAAEDA